MRVCQMIGEKHSVVSYTDCLGCGIKTCPINRILRILEMTVATEIRTDIKSCYNCDFWIPENKTKCSNIKAVCESPWEDRDPPGAGVIYEKGCELFQSTKGARKNE